MQKSIGNAGTLSLCALFVALIAVGNFIRIPIPPIPITLQLLFTALAGMLLGAKRGMICCAAYVLIGLCGFPIFTGGCGPQYIFHPTFGMLIGFVPVSYTHLDVYKRQAPVGRFLLVFPPLCGQPQRQGAGF